MKIAVWTKMDSKERSYIKALSKSEVARDE